MGSVKKENGKIYIENIRKVCWDSGEMCEFASCLAAALESCGEHVPYDFIMGTSGVAFRFTLNPREWDFTNYSIRNIEPDTYAAIRRAFTAVGYECKLCEPSTFDEDSAAIMESINRGMPVLVFRVVGPSDCCVISGYDDNGKVLLGWSTFQDIKDDHDIPHDSSGYFRKPGWHENLPGYILIGSKVDRPDLRQVYLDALKNATGLMRTAEMNSKLTGLNGLRAWAEEMNQEEFFPAGEPEVVGQRYVSAAINMTMLRDHCTAEPFLQRAAMEVPDLEPELSRAAKCYGEVRRIRDGMDEMISDNFSPRAMQAIFDPEVRRRYAEAILEIRDAEEEAVGEFERLVERCG